MLTSEQKRIDASPTRVFFESMKKDDHEQKQLQEMDSHSRRNIFELRIPDLLAPLTKHVFISYNSETGRDVARLLQMGLTQCGFHVWFDQTLNGQITEDAMMKGVAESRMFLMLLTKGVLKKPFCQKEIRQALSLKKRILFVHEDDRRQMGFSEFDDKWDSVNSTTCAMKPRRICNTCSKTWNPFPSSAGGSI